MIQIKDFIILFLIFLRISSALIASPVYGNRAIPVVVKLFLALLVSYLVFLTIDRTALYNQPSGWMLFVLSVKEVITGLIIGFLLQIVFWGVSYAGTLIGFDLGLNMAEVFNPHDEVNSNVVGEFLYYGAIMIFLLINGHHYIISSLKYSYSVISIGELKMSTDLNNLIIKYTASMFVIAVKIASPIIVSFFLIHIAEGIIARLIPQMSVFFVTQPLKIGVGLILLGVITPMYVYIIKNLLTQYEGQLNILIRTMGI